MRRLLPLVMCTILAGQSCAQTGGAAASTISIPLGGNAWISGPNVKAHLGDPPFNSIGAAIDTAGLTGWDDTTATVSIWFRLSHTGKLHIQLETGATEGKALLGLQLAGQSRNVEVGGGSRVGGGSGGGAGANRKSAADGGSGSTGGGVIDAGEWNIIDTGYQQLSIRGIRKSGRYFADIHSILISGSAAAMPIAYVPNNEGNYFHWGRRGPSVHFSYPVPGNASVEWFYNEVTVPAGQDIIGSYFMADGFSQGYFGMQVNSPTERRLLFSVWSPFNTDDPTAIPDSLKIKLLAKGEGVHTGAFGNEGSGGQSYLVFPWQAGKTYRFLMHAVPGGMSAAGMGNASDGATGSENAVATNYTDFTAWFAAPEDKHWRLIASWRRPSTRTWLVGLHSFLENFEPDNGNQQRSVLFNHEWVRDTEGKWTQLYRGRFTVDNTARKGYRRDYDGGIKEGSFYLHNGGFFNKNVAPNSWFTRPVDENAKPPMLPEVTRISASNAQNL